ncbi:hypothetical protein EV368DRAFT_67574 [Lentinula lateritia]|uniref:Uncharacterized protein n=1 Tax=Lentinula aff. lateritia TaxID=2804960 RepID=A0ACC1TQE2_9AGAR|nr:hypothetical protein F5876DRAFT_68618 [Lentinula aff. lateritia]KAJ3849279.1 hypothetical protein EV368DRAFT_67574 [Lentinula lateritia]
MAAGAASSALAAPMHPLPVAQEVTHGGLFTARSDDVNLLVHPVTSTLDTGEFNVVINHEGAHEYHHQHAKHHSDEYEVKVDEELELNSDRPNHYDKEFEIEKLPREHIHSHLHAHKDHHEHTVEVVPIPDPHAVGIKVVKEESWLIKMADAPFNHLPVGLVRRQSSQNLLAPSPATAPDTFKPPTPTTHSHGGTKAKLTSMMAKVTQHPKFISMMRNPQLLKLMQHPKIAPYADKFGLNGSGPAKNAAAASTLPVENPVPPIASAAPQIPPLNFDVREVADPTSSDSSSFSPSPSAKSVRLARSFLAPCKDGDYGNGASGSPSGNTGIPPTSHQTHGAQPLPPAPGGVGNSRISTGSWTNDSWYPSVSNAHSCLGQLTPVQHPENGHLSASNAGPSISGTPPPGTSSNMPPHTRRVERHQEAKTFPYHPTYTLCRPGTLCGRSDNPEFEQWFMDMEKNMASVYLQTSTWAEFLKTPVGQKVEQKGPKFEDYVRKHIQQKLGPPLYPDLPLTYEDCQKEFVKMERMTKLASTYICSRTWSAFWESESGREVMGKGPVFKAFVQEQMETKWGLPLEHCSSASGKPSPCNMRQF